MRIKDIADNKYMFCEDGAIWSKCKKAVKKPQKGRGGYSYVVLMCKDGKQHPFKVHRVIAELFCPKPEHLKDISIEQLDVDHIDGNRENNNSHNLRWCTRKENSNYEETKKRRSEAHKNTKVPNRWKKVYQYTLDGQLVNIFKSLGECRENGYCYGDVSECCRGRRYKTHKGFRWSYMPL